MNNCNNCENKNSYRCFGCDKERFFKEKTKEKKPWQLAEERALKKFKSSMNDIKMTPGSGNRYLPGDLRSREAYIEVKSTQRKSFRIKKETIQSIKDESASHKIWILNIEFQDEEGNPEYNISVVDTGMLTALLKQLKER